MKALKLLQRREWTMGNGQCHECCGCKPRKGWHTETVGHVKGCGIALAIEELGGKVVWERKNHSKSRRDLERWFKRAWAVPVFLFTLPLFAETNILTREGTTYTNAVIQRADPNGIVIEYAIRPGALGLAKLKFTNLPDVIQRKYNFNTTNAHVFEQNQLSGSLRTITAEERARKDAEAWAAYWASVRRSEEIVAAQEAAERQRAEDARKQSEEQAKREQLQREAVYQQLQWINDGLYQLNQPRR